MTMFRTRVGRADGRAINVVQRRAHLSYCFTGCCCGRTERGYAAVPVDTFKDNYYDWDVRPRQESAPGVRLHDGPAGRHIALLSDADTDLLALKRLHGGPNGDGWIERVRRNVSWMKNRLERSLPQGGHR